MENHRLLIARKDGVSFALNGVSELTGLVGAAVNEKKIAIFVVQFQALVAVIQAGAIRQIPAFDGAYFLGFPVAQQYYFIQRVALCFFGVPVEINGFAILGPKCPRWRGADPYFRVLHDFFDRQSGRCSPGFWSGLCLGKRWKHQQGKEEWVKTGH